MFGNRKTLPPVAEHEARDQEEAIYHDIRHTLRASGVNLNLRTWAAYPEFFPVMWRAVRPNLESQTFERLSDQLRMEAVETAARLGLLNVPAHVKLGESQTWQIRAALNLYHYVNPKLLLLTSTVRLALAGKHTGEGLNDAAGIERGIPDGMYPMEMVSDPPQDRALRKVFSEMRRTLSLTTINSDYRTLALWPHYLQAAWKQLKPTVKRNVYTDFADTLRESSRYFAQQLPYAVEISTKQLQRQGEKISDIVRITDTFERILPPLIVNISLLVLDWKTEAEARQSPFPARVVERRRSA